MQSRGFWMSAKLGKGAELMHCAYMPPTTHDWMMLFPLSEFIQFSWIIAPCIYAKAASTLVGRFRLGSSFPFFRDIEEINRSSITFATVVFLSNECQHSPRGLSFFEIEYMSSQYSRKWYMYSDLHWRSDQRSLDQGQDDGARFCSNV